MQNRECIVFERTHATEQQNNFLLLIVFRLKNNKKFQPGNLIKGNSWHF